MHGVLGEGPVWEAVLDIKLWHAIKVKLFMKAEAIIQVCELFRDRRPCEPRKVTCLIPSSQRIFIRLDF